MNSFFKKLFGISSPDIGLKKLIDEGAVLVDVRTPAEFAAGAVKNSINIPLDKLPQQLNKLKKDSTIIIFCRTGNRSSMAKSFLEQKGFNNIVNGGGWKEVKAITE